MELFRRESSEPHEEEKKPHEQGGIFVGEQIFNQVEQSGSGIISLATDKGIPAEIMNGRYETGKTIRLHGPNAKTLDVKVTGCRATGEYAEAQKHNRVYEIGVEKIG